MSNLLYLCPQHYYNTHKNESKQFQLMMESDIGTFSPLGLAFTGTQEATCIIQEVMNLLQALNTTQVWQLDILFLSDFSQCFYSIWYLLMDSQT